MKSSMYFILRVYYHLFVKWNLFHTNQIKTTKRGKQNTNTKKSARYHRIMLCSFKCKLLVLQLSYLVLG